jgi:hypothetical protein
MEKVSRDREALARRGRESMMAATTPTPGVPLAAGLRDPGNSDTSDSEISEATNHHVRTLEHDLEEDEDSKAADVGMNDKETAKVSQSPQFDFSAVEKREAV